MGCAVVPESNEQLWCSAGECYEEMVNFAKRWTLKLSGFSMDKVCYNVQFKRRLGI